MVCIVRLDATESRPLTCGTFNECSRSIATGSDARAGILPKRNALSKRKLSELIRGAPQRFTVFPQRPLCC